MKKAFLIMQKEVKDFLRDKGDLSFGLLLPVLIFALMYGVPVLNSTAQRIS
jgi:ABC-type Na+ efflux pump permease subunit